MAVALADLTARLDVALPSLTAPQATSAVKSAIGAFSNKAGMVKRQAISVVAGTATYDLADDFISLIRMEGLTAMGDVWIQGDGTIIPSAGNVTEKVTIAGRSITFVPTPQYTTTRYVWYRAGYIAIDGTYNDLTEEMAEIVMVKAQANGLRLLATSNSTDGWKYSIGDVMVDKSNLARGLRESAGELDKEFEAMVKAFVGPVGVRATYHPDESISV